MNLDPVCDVLDAFGAAYCLIGAHAMAARGYPRFTVDVDLLTTDARVLERATWSGLAAAGATVDPRRGSEDDPLAGVVHIRLSDESEFDVVLAKWKWEAHVIARASLMRVAGRDVRVPRLSDLILLKLAAGGYTDRQDAAALLALEEREVTIAEVEAHIDEVRPDIRPEWAQLLAATR